MITPEAGLGVVSLHVRKMYVLSVYPHACVERKGGWPKIEVKYEQLEKSG